MQITDCGYVVGSPFYFSFSLQFCDVRLYSFVHGMMVVVGLGLLFQLRMIVMMMMHSRRRMMVVVMVPVDDDEDIR